MPRFWYSFAGPQTIAGYSQIGNYIYLNIIGNPPCNGGNNICSMYALGDPTLIHRTSSNPTTLSPANSLIPAAVTNGSNQYIGTRLYLTVRGSA